MPDSQKLFFPFLLVFFEMATYLSNDMYLPALPLMMHELSITPHQAQMALTTWFFGSISAQLILGPLSDRYGRKLILCLGAILFVLSSLVCALAPNLQVLLIARFIQGTGICFIAVPGYASIHESFQQKQAIRILALMGSIAVLAPAFGPLLGSVVLSISNWRWIFGFLVIWSSIATILLIIWMPETLPHENRHEFNMNAMFQRYRNILKNSHFLITLCSFGFMFCGFIAWIAAGPFLVIDQFKYKPIYFGIFQAAIFSCYITASYLVRYLIERVDIHKMIRYGLYGSMFGSILSLVLAMISPHYLFGMILSLMIFSFGSGFAFSPLNRLAIESSIEPMGARMAIVSTVTSGFATLATLLVNIFYNGSLISLSYILVIAMVFSIVFEKMRSKSSVIPVLISHGETRDRNPL
jgi:Bcr/CflA subfamily drug resistance transporter